MNLRTIMALVCVLLAASGLGCTGKRESVDQRRATSGGSPLPVPPKRGLRGSPATPGNAVVDSASSVAEIFSQVHEHETALSELIAAGRLNELGIEASRIRELLGTVVRLAQVPPDQRADLEGHVAEAKSAAIGLLEAGKAGNLEGSQARNADLQRELGIVERMVAAHEPEQK
jgi:hypothetical protein